MLIPLTVLGKYLELLKAQHEHQNPMRQSHLLPEALESYGELVRLVDWVLDATISEELPLVHCEVVSVRRGVQEVLVSLNSVDAQASTIRLEIAKQVVV